MAERGLSSPGDVGRRRGRGGAQRRRARAAVARLDQIDSRRLTARTLAFTVAALACSAASTARAQQPYFQPYGQPQQQPYPQQPYPQQQVPQQQVPQQQTYPQQQPYGPQPVYGAPATGQPASSASYDDDSGRTLEFFYVRAGASGAMVASEALSKGHVRFPDATGFGGAFDVGVGLRLLVLTIGPRARAMLLSNGTYLQLGGEAAFRIPMGRLDPFVGVEGGYTTAKKSDVSVNGGDVGIMGGLDYYVTPMISVGGHASASLLFLSSTGFGAVLGAHVALHL